MKFYLHSFNEFHLVLIQGRLLFTLDLDVRKIVCIAVTLYADFSIFPYIGASISSKYPDHSKPGVVKSAADIYLCIFITGIILNCLNLKEIRHLRDNYSPF